MKRYVVIFLLAVPLLLTGDATTVLENTTTQPTPIISDSIGLSVSLLDHIKNSVFKQRIKFNPASHANITVINIPSDVWFIVLQVHTFQYNITIGYDKTTLDKVSNRSLFGSNIGLYFETHNVTTPIQAFLKNDNVRSVDMLVAIVTYGQKAPIPGGCNMEFDIEVAPYQKLHAKNEMIIVDTQPALALDANGHRVSCEKSVLEHKMYRLYLPGRDFTPETYFEAIASMLTVQDIVQNSNEIPVGLMSPIRRIYSAYAGTGSVYAAVATYGDVSSAYIPIFTYACSPLLYPESCEVLDDTFAKVVCTLVLIIGFAALLHNFNLLHIIIEYIEHTNIDFIFTFIDRSLSSCMMNGIFGYILAVIFSNYSTGINILIGLSTAILCAILLDLLARLSVELPLSNLPLGILCACITYLYAPAWMFYILESEWLFWPMFLSLMIALAILATIISSTLVNAIFGSFYVIIAIDYYIGGNLKYIIITLIRRVTIPGFRLAIVYPPHQYTDSILIIFWLVMIVVRLIFFCYGCVKDSESSETDSLLPNYHYGNYSGIKRNFRKRPRYYRRWRF